MLFIMIAIMLVVLTAPFLLFVYFGARELPRSIMSHEALSPETLEVIKIFSDNILIGSGLIILICIIFAFFASVAISRQMLTPLKEIARGLNMIGKGAEGVNISLTGSRELNELEEVFNKASNNISLLSKDLSICIASVKKV